MSLVGIPSVMRQARVFGFENGIGGKRRGHEDDGGVGSGLLDGLGNGVENRPALVRGASLTWCYSAHYLGPILGAALGVEGAFLAGDALHDEPRVFVY
jgi:hypothetical protein